MPVGNCGGGGGCVRHPPHPSPSASPRIRCKTDSAHARAAVHLGVVSYHMPDMDLCGHRSSRSGAFLLSLLVLLGSAQAMPVHAARASRTSAAFAASGHAAGGFVPGRTRARRGTQHRYPHQHVSGGAIDSEPRRKCGRAGRHQLRPPSNLGRTFMSSVDQQEIPPDEQQQQEGQERFPESGRGALSRASFVQAAAGSAAAVVALSLVSFTTCTYYTRCLDLHRSAHPR